MQARPKLIVFDIIETVMSLETLRPRFEAAGLPPETLELWFASGLRDAFAIAAAGGFRPFAEVLRGVLGQIAPDVTDEQSATIVGGMSELRPHEEARPALETLASAGFRLVALSNGAATTTRKLLRDGGLEGFFERVGSVDDAQASKPRPEVYRTLLQACDVAPEHACMVAAHAWDVNGAMAAGLTGVFIARGQRYPAATMAAPDIAAETLVEAAEALSLLPHR